MNHIIITSSLSAQYWSCSYEWTRENSMHIFWSKMISCFFEWLWIYFPVDYSITKKAFTFPKKHGMPFYFVSASDGTNVVKVSFKYLLIQFNLHVVNVHRYVKKNGKNCSALREWFYPEAKPVSPKGRLSRRMLVF